MRRGLAIALLMLAIAGCATAPVEPPPAPLPPALPPPAPAPAITEAPVLPPTYAARA